MSGFTSGKRNGKEVRGENLRPIQPGQVLNPEGKNQWTGTRREFERHIALIADEPSDGDPSITKAEALARKAWELALKGDRVAFREVLKRLSPEVKTVLSGQDPNSGPVQAQVDISSLNDEERAMLRKLAAKALERPKEVA